MNTQLENTEQLENGFRDYLGFYESITVETIDQLENYVTADIEFKDPFNHVFTADDTLQIFRHMYTQVINPKFEILNSQLSTAIGMVHWQFSFQTSESAKTKIIKGMSLIEVNAAGRVCKHTDYWDPAEYIYEDIPLFGSLIKLIKKRLKAT